MAFLGQARGWARPGLHANIGVHGARGKREVQGGSGDRLVRHLGGEGGEVGGGREGVMNDVGVGAEAGGESGSGGDSKVRTALFLSGAHFHRR